MYDNLQVKILESLIHSLVVEGHNMFEEHSFLLPSSGTLVHNHSHHQVEP